MIPPPSRSTGFSSTFRANRCFATTADGRIPITNDWQRLLRAVTGPRPVALQSRHTSARLIRLAPLPVDAVVSHGLTDAACHLQVDLDRITEVAGRLEPCPCCDSPGRIEFFNTVHSECLQLCAPAGQTPADWARTLSGLVDGAPGDLRADPTSGHRHTLPLAAAPQLGRTADVRRLVDFCAAWGDSHLALAVTLQTDSVRHTETFVPECSRLAGHLFQLRGDAATLQLSLPTVAELRGTANALEAINPDGARLLAFTPAASDATTADLWREALSRMFSA